MFIVMLGNLDPRVRGDDDGVKNAYQTYLADAATVR